MYGPFVAFSVFLIIVQKWTFRPPQSPNLLSSKISNKSLHVGSLARYNYEGDTIITGSKEEILSFLGSTGPLFGLHRVPFWFLLAID